MKAGELVVIVEEQNRGQVWVVVITDPTEDADLAARKAYELAREHRPARPSMPKERTLFRRQDGSWLVCVRGAMSKSYFSVSVVEVEGSYPA